ncbi:MAG TPA: flagellar hook protein FlgE [Alphaproteobacteria bacterium]
MSLYGALLAGVSGLRAQSQSLGTISDNIANVNTIGYKRSVAAFSTLVTGASSTTQYYPGGVRATPRSLIDQQGVLQGSSRGTDIAILGNGFFVVNTDGSGNGEQLYTRAGSFSEDNNGRLVNAAGYFLQGWELDQQGNIIDINTIKTVSVSTLNGVAVDTTTVQLLANLDSGQTAGTPAYTAADFTADPTGALTIPEEIAAGTIQPHFKREIAVFDALGTKHNLTLSFHRLTGTNEWGFVLSAGASEVDTGAASVTGGLLAHGTITFDGDGNLDTVTWHNTADWVAGVTTADPTQTVAITWTNGASPSNIAFNLGTPGKSDGVRQFNGPYDVGAVNQDGAEVGLRTGVYIDSEGYVVASFSNGATQRIYKLPIATFANPTKLEARNGNAYAQTDLSGEYNLREANTGGAGRIEPAALEGSNVDLGEEFTAMIVTQRAYSASAKTITTADEMLDELLRIKR